MGEKQKTEGCRNKNKQDKQKNQKEIIEKIGEEKDRRKKKIDLKDKQKKKKKIERND